MIHFRKLYKVTLLLILGIQSAYSFAETKDTASKAMSQVYENDTRPMNSISLNLLGNASIASLNYERLFPVQSEHFFLAAGLGVGLNTFVTLHSGEGTPFTLDNFAVIPHHVTGNIGGGRHFFELGLGGAVITSPGGQPYLSSILMGYRLQPLNSNRISARLYTSYPLQALEKFDIIYIPVGISVGWAF